MPKTFYDKNGSELGTFYTKAENDALLSGKQNIINTNNIGSLSTDIVINFTTDGNGNAAVDNLNLTDGVYLYELWTVNDDTIIGYQSMFVFDSGAFVVYYDDYGEFGIKMFTLYNDSSRLLVEKLDAFINTNMILKLRKI